MTMSSPFRESYRESTRCLTIPQLKPWTSVSIMFVLVRYVGLCGVILIAFDGSTFVPGPVRICTAISLVSFWDFAIFLATADLLMILRIYAMWNQTKWIFYSLLFIYVPQAIVSFVFTGVYNDPNKYLSVSIVQIVDFSICKSAINKSTALIHFYVSIPRFVLGVILLVLAVIPALKESVQRYKTTKEWRSQANQYLQRLMRDCVFYFLMNVLLTAYRILQSQLAGTDASLHYLTAFSYMILFPMMPRFIISIRELYDHDLRGHRQQGIDTGFGYVVSENAAESAISFADVDPRQGQGQVVVGDADDPETIWLEVLGDGMRQGVEGDAGDSKAIRLGAFEDGTV